MSQTSLHSKDQGYTPPDFLANLFKKPLYTPVSLTHIHTSNSLQDKIQYPNDKQNKVGSLRVIDNQSSSQNKSSSKLFRSFSVNQEERVHSKKYKIFFKTLLQNSMSEEDMNHLWDKMESSLNNPYAFDQLLEEVKENRSKQAEEVVKEIKIEKVEKQIIRKPKIRSKSAPFIHKVLKQQNQFSSPQKKSFEQMKTSLKEQKQATKQSILKEVLDIKAILFKGNRDILKKK